MNVEQRPIDSIKPYGKNPRRNDAAVDAVAESIRRFGFRQPIVVDADGVIIVGHTRWKAARKLGLEEVPVHVADGLTDDEARAYRLVDNRTAELAEWDPALLRGELDALEADVSAFGFDGLLPKAETAQDAEPQVDKGEELNKVWNVQPGDLWLIGDHRLLCGDSTNAAGVARLLGDRKPVLMVTDPPYGVEYDAWWRVEALQDGKQNGTAVGKVTNDDRADWREAWALFPGDVAYVWHADCRSPEVAESLAACDFERRALIIWAKNTMVIGRGDYHHQHEPAWYCVRKGKPGLRTDDRKQTTLWQIDKPQKSKTGHSTQKPVECMARPMRNHDAAEVYDPFLGSGTTMVAGQNLGRKVYGLEITPNYCAVILQRMADAFPGIEIRRA